MKMNVKLQYEPICKENLETAIKIQKALFPLEEGEQDLIDGMNSTPPPHQFLQTYWVAYHKKTPVGIVGLYAYKAYPKDAWLGWYGVLKEHRNKGFGREIFEFAKDQAKAFGFENLRLYTDEEDNFVATKLYEKLGMTSEYYENNEDKYYTASRVVIYSISLTGKPCEKWNSKNLSLGSHEEWNKR